MAPLRLLLAAVPRQRPIGQHSPIRIYGPDGVLRSLVDPVTRVERSARTRRKLRVRPRPVLEGTPSVGINAVWVGLRAGHG